MRGRSLPGTIAAVVANERPREKLARAGAATLTDDELLAVVLGHGRPGRSALTLAVQILGLAGGVGGLTRLHPKRLAAVAGIGPAQASRMKAAIELGRRTMVDGVPRPRFMSSREMAMHLLPQYGAHPVERFGVMLLDTRWRLITTRLVSIGSLDASTAHPREVFREALLGGAAAVVAFHNHPSGDPHPSRDDVALTARLKQAGHVLGVELVDHLILADAQYCSLREAQLF